MNSVTLSGAAGLGLVMRLSALGLFIFGFTAQPVHGALQDDPDSSTAPVVEQTDDDEYSPRFKAIEAAIAEVEKDQSLDETKKEELTSVYNKALGYLSAAREAAKESAEFANAVDKSTKKAQEHEAATEQLQTQEVTIPDGLDDTKKVQREIDRQEAEIGNNEGKLSKVQEDLSAIADRRAQFAADGSRIKERLAVIGDRLNSTELTAESLTPERTAERAELLAEQQKLTAEQRRLEQEQTSEPFRQDELEAELQLLRQRNSNALAAIALLTEELKKELSFRVIYATEHATRLQNLVPENDAEAVALANDVVELAEQFATLVDTLGKVAPARDLVRSRRAATVDQYERIKNQVDADVHGPAMAKVIFGLEGEILDARRELIAVDLPALDATQLEYLQVRFEQEQQPKIVEQFKTRDAQVQELVTLRGEILEELHIQYRELVRALAAVDGERRDFLDQSEVIQESIRQDLLGLNIRSYPTIGWHSFVDLPAAVAWFFSGAHLNEIISDLRQIGNRYPTYSLAVLLIGIALLIARPWIIRELKKTGEKTRPISTDRMKHTFEAVGLTALLALPIPWLLVGAGMGLERVNLQSDWMHGFAQGVVVVANALMLLLFLLETLRSGGLAEVHFGWQDDEIAPWRRAGRRFTIAYVPTILIEAGSRYGDASPYFESLGRITFIVAHLWIAFIIWRLLHGPQGMSRRLASEYAGWILTRSRYLWSFVAISLPVTLAILSADGFAITAASRSIAFFFTSAIIMAGVFLYALAMRWLSMKQRKLALSEALEKRRAAVRDRQGGEGKEDVESHDLTEVVSIEPEEERELDIEAVGEQTSNLLRLICGLGTVISILLYWSSTFSVFQKLNEIPIPLAKETTLLGLAQALIIAITVGVCYRNLPGLFDLLGFRSANLYSGTRYAIITLCRYGLLAFGVLLVFNALKFDWSQFGWIAGGLSVGIGFGMQEVVANFICGLILLFERPIRVGDVVTINNTTGTVSRIQLRATTITTWDRQEFVVPNKVLITGTILNWTLTEALNRIVIAVPVANGTDTEKARQLLLDIASTHSNVLKDPSPIASFDQFANGNLQLILRVYLPDMDNRIGTRTALCTEIQHRFADEGIEISAPQQDLKLRTGWSVVEQQMAK